MNSITRWGAGRAAVNRQREEQRGGLRGRATAARVVESARRGESIERVSGTRVGVHQVCSGDKEPGCVEDNGRESDREEEEGEDARRRGRSESKERTQESNAVDSEDGEE